MAIFLENFELDDEAKAQRQVDSTLADLQETVLEGDDTGQFDTNRTAQLRLLQMSMYLENNHVFKRLPNFRVYGGLALLSAPKGVSKCIRIVKSLPRSVEAARTRLRIKFTDRKGEFKQQTLVSCREELALALMILQKATAAHETVVAQIGVTKEDSQMQGWLSEVTSETKADASIYSLSLFEKHLHAVCLQAGLGLFSVRQTISMADQVFTKLDENADGLICKKDVIQALSHLQDPLSKEALDSVMLEMRVHEQKFDSETVHRKLLTAPVSCSAFQNWWDECETWRYRGQGRELIAKLQKLISVDVMLQSSDSVGSTDLSIIDKLVQELEPAFQEEEERGILRLDMSRCRLSSVTEQKKRYIFKISERGTGESYTFASEQEHEAEKWIAVLEHNKEFKIKIKKLDNERISTAADVVAAQENVNRCQDAVNWLTGKTKHKGVLNKLATKTKTLANSGALAVSVAAVAAQRRIKEEAKQRVQDFMDESDTPFAINANLKIAREDLLELEVEYTGLTNNLNKVRSRAVSFQAALNA